MNYPDLARLKTLYAQGINITGFLKESLGEDFNSALAIEVAYDLQAGSYIRAVENNPLATKRYTQAIADALSPHIRPSDVVLDAGTGEMTTYGPVMDQIRCQSALNFDISLSRLLAGRQWLEGRYRDVYAVTNSFVSTLHSIPLASRSTDVTWTSHSIEPNHGKEKQILSELIRVTRRLLVLFEPSFEDANREGRQRMEKYGYIRGLIKIIEECGGILVSKQALDEQTNPLNPTYCYVVQVDHLNCDQTNHPTSFVIPSTNYELDGRGPGCLFSTKGLLAFPCVGDIPLLREEFGFPLTHPEYLPS
jgi:hypothetical protein